jgi:hypothetical protein
VLSTRYLSYRLITSDGTTVVSSGDIGSWTDLTEGPSLIQLANGTIILAYSRESSGACHLCTRTTTSFTAWSSESPLTISGISTANLVENPSFVQLSSGALWLWFDYVESTAANGSVLTNCWYTVSADNGVTWVAATKVTSYTGFGEVAQHPVASMSGSDAMDMVFTEVMASLHMDSTISGWLANSSFTPSDLHFDPVHRMLYVTLSLVGPGTKYFGSVVKIDVDAWSIVNSWDTTTVPAFPSIYASVDVGSRIWHGDGDWVPVGCFDNGRQFISVLNGANNTIVTYVFGTYPGSGMYANVLWTPFGNIGNTATQEPPYGLYYPYSSIACAWVDAASHRLYAALVNYIAGSTFDLQVGYIDLNDTGTMGGDGILRYQFTNVITETNIMNWYQMMGLTNLGGGGMLVDPDDDRLILSYATDSVGGAGGRLRVYQLSTGALVNDLSTAGNAAFPFGGIHRGFTYSGGVIYGGFAYSAAVGESDKKGLCIINTANSSITYSVPGFATVNDYGIENGEVIATGDGRFIISCNGYGIGIYHNGAWTLFDNAGIPDLTPSGENLFVALAFDPLSGSIFAGCGQSSAVWNGVVMFSQDGVMEQLELMTGALSGGAWSFATASPLVSGYTDYAASIANAPTGLMAFWVEGITTPQIYWGSASADFAVSDYLVTTAELSIARTIDGQPAQLTFQVADGCLFDPHNLKSLWSQYLAKGRLLTVQLGELVDGVEYWVNQGSFIVTETALSYSLGEYPVMNVTAADISTLWSNIHIFASPYYQTDPVSILLSLIPLFTSILESGIDLPAFVNSETLNYQWVDTDLATAVEQICERFGYYHRMDVNGKVTAKPVSMSNPVDHAYPDNSQTSNFSPDDTYSDFTNQVIVTGETGQGGGPGGYIQVVYPAQRVGQVSGAHNWHDGRKDYTVYYSIDESQTVINPYLVKISSVSSMMFALGGGCSEKISFVDPADKYCIVSLISADLTAELVASLAAIIGAYFVPDQVVTAGVGASTGYTIRWGSYLDCLFIMTALNILAATATFQYEVWGNPVGYVRQSVQGEWDDYASQASLGSVCAKTIADPLCYSQSDCATVAAFEGMVAQAQRSRVTFQKVMNLQDEDGDTITIPHPYTGDTMTVFITQLTRRILPNRDGYAWDEIEGWVR